jgi:hypothetical protein
MLDFPRQERFVTLVDEAINRAAHLKFSQNAALAPAFNRALQILEATASAKHQQALLLAAARQHIAHAEKQVVGQIIGDEPIFSDEMSDLVRIRVICLELASILNNSLDRLKNLPARR